MKTTRRAPAAVTTIGIWPVAALVLALAATSKSQRADPASVVLMVTGAQDPLVLREAARVVQQRLRQLDGAKRVTLIGDPGARLVVRLDPALATRLGLDGRLLANRKVFTRTNLVAEVAPRLYGRDRAELDRVLARIVGVEEHVAHAPGRDVEGHHVRGELQGEPHRPPGRRALRQPW